MGVASIIFLVAVFLAPSIGLFRNVHEFYGPGVWAIVLLLWLGILTWRVWRGQRLPFWRAMGCGVIVFALAIPLSLVAEFPIAAYWVHVDIKRAKADFVKKVDVPAIREWAQHYQPDSNDVMDHDGSVTVAQENLPPCIRMLEPLDVSYDPNAKEVKIYKKTGFWRGGITVTQTNVDSFNAE